MDLTIECGTVANELRVHYLSRRFVEKILERCVRENRFLPEVHEAFLQYYYLNRDTVSVIAAQVGQEWRTWDDNHALHELNPLWPPERLRVLADGSQIAHYKEGLDDEASLDLDAVAIESEPVTLESFLIDCEDDELVAFSGRNVEAVGTYTLAGFEGDFNPAKLRVQVDDYSEFDGRKLVSGMAYDGAPLRPELRTKARKGMLEVVFFEADGERLTLHDLVRRKNIST
jgi:hypothetical protein